MESLRQYQTLQRKLLAMDEGVRLLRQVRSDFQQSRSSAKTWGDIAVVTNAILVPLNCIVNALQVNAAKTTYQILVKALYDQVARSGTRFDGPVKDVLSKLKKAIVEDLRRKALTTLVPGVNILVGLAEDSVALMQVAMTVDANGREAAALAASIDRQLAKAIRELERLGIEHALILARHQHISRTA